MWFPLVITSTPASRKPRASAGVTPNPAAAFSTLATTRSTWSSLLTCGRNVTRARRPGSPNTSPMHRMVSVFTASPSVYPNSRADRAQRANSVARCSRITVTLT